MKKKERRARERLAKLLKELKAKRSLTACLTEENRAKPENIREALQDLAALRGALERCVGSTKKLSWHTRSLAEVDQLIAQAQEALATARDV